MTISKGAYNFPLNQLLGEPSLDVIGHSPLIKAHHRCNQLRGDEVVLLKIIWFYFHEWRNHELRRYFKNKLTSSYIPRCFTVRLANSRLAIRFNCFILWEMMGNLVEFPRSACWGKVIVWHKNNTHLILVTGWSGAEIIDLPLQCHHFVLLGRTQLGEFITDVVYERVHTWKEDDLLK